MHKLKFTEDDKKKFIDFLNHVAKHGQFTMKTDDIINYYRLLSHMQQSILPKIDANIFEVVSVVEPQSEPEVKNNKASKKK